MGLEVVFRDGLRLDTDESKAGNGIFDWYTDVGTAEDGALSQTAFLGMLDSLLDYWAYLGSREPGIVVDVSLNVRVDEIFYAADEDGDGAVSKNEWHACVHGIGGCGNHGTFRLILHV